MQPVFKPYIPMSIMAIESIPITLIL